MRSAGSTIQTARLVLRPLQPGDAAVLQRIYQSEGVLRYFPNPHSPELERVKSFIAGQQAHWEKHGYGDWAIIPQGEQRLAGWAGLQYLPELDESEVGFLLDRPFWGRGFATEAAQASLHFGFRRLSLGHIIALVHAENQASMRVIEKCGMQYVDCQALWGIELRRYRVDRDDFDRIDG